MSGVPATVIDFLNQEYTNGNLIRPRVALQKLMASPRKFLQTYPLEIVERAGPSGIATYYLTNLMMPKVQAMRPGTVLKTQRMHETESFIFWNSMPKDNDLTTVESTQVHCVGMFPSNQAIQWHPLVGGPNLMLTCKLTGCSFVCRKNGNNLEAAHLQPTAEDGLALNQRLAVPGQTAWGRLKYDFDHRTCTILGVRTGSKWKIYVQKLDKGTLTIKSVHRVYPPELGA